MNLKALKENARKSLEGKWKNTIIILILYMIITVLASSLDLFVSKQIFEPTVINGVETTQSLNIISLIVACLIGLGYTSYFLKVSRGETPEYNELFSKTHLFGGFLLLSILMAIFITLWTLLLIIPGIIAAISYSQAALIKIDNEEMGAMDCIKKSKELMNGHKWEYCKLVLSFIGWFILGAFTFGILYFWLIPYVSVAECNFYNELIKEKK